MHINVKRLNFVKNKVKEIYQKKQLKTAPQIIAVTKTFSLNEINPLIENGHIHFGENKIQETESKWENVRLKYQNLQLHMLGKLQTNKAKKAVKLFDFIHSLDNAKLAQKLNQFENELNKKIKLFIQVNVGDENQKNGIMISDLKNFYNYCTKELSLNVVGLMCLPPINSNSVEYFTLLKRSADELNLKDLCMGMSSDFETATIKG